MIFALNIWLPYLYNENFKLYADTKRLKYSFS